MARGTTLDHRAWGIANEARTKLRYAWQEFFQRYDVLLTPVAATAAFLHDHNPDRDRRLIAVNGRQRSPMATSASGPECPASPICRPLLLRSGLPRQAFRSACRFIGAEGEDPTTIEFARLLAAEIGGFAPPPDFT